MISKDDSFRLKAAKFSFVIRDPFPEHSRYEQLRGSPLLKRAVFFGLFIKETALPAPEPISIHGAWKMGFDFACSVYERRIDDLVEKK